MHLTIQSFIYITGSCRFLLYFGLESNTVLLVPQFVPALTVMELFQGGSCILLTPSRPPFLSGPLSFLQGASGPPGFFLTLALESGSFAWRHAPLVAAPACPCALVPPPLPFAPLCLSSAWRTWGLNPGLRGPPYVLGNPSLMMFL